MLPTPFYSQGNSVKIYFSPRNSQNQGYITYLIYNLNSGKIDFSGTPILSPGKIGHFDDEGCLVGTIIKDRLYYLGWNNSVNIPFRNTIGTAVKRQDKWERQPGPIISRSKWAPCGLTPPCVLWDKVTNQWIAFVGVFYKWGTINYQGEKVLTYATSIGKLVSSDGFSWEWETNKLFDVNESIMEKIARPWVVKLKNGYHMWYSVRVLDEPYKLGYAFSVNGYYWERRDEEMKYFNELKREKWEKDMLCYPTIFQTGKNDLYMLYNGNGYGKTGFGLAILEQW